MKFLLPLLDRCYAVVKIYRALYIPYSALLGGPKSYTVLQGIYSALLGGPKSHTVLQGIYSARLGGPKPHTVLQGICCNVNLVLVLVLVRLRNCMHVLSTCSSFSGNVVIVTTGPLEASLASLSSAVADRGSP